MESPWGMTPYQKLVADFTDALANDIASILTGEYSNVDVGASPLDKNSGFMIMWEYAERHRAEIMVSKSREGEENALAVNEFVGVQPVVSFGRKIPPSMPYHLRTAAAIYEKVGELLSHKFGKPVSEHHGRIVYRAHLEKCVDSA